MKNLNRMFQWCIDTCADSNVGYSQAYREQQTVNGITYYDCSSFVWYALLAGNFDCEEAMLDTMGDGSVFATNWGMKDALEWLRFTPHDPSNLIWEPGDILWRSGHTEIVYKGDIQKGVGYTMGAHSAKVPLDKQVSINSAPTRSGYWNKLYRFEERDVIKGSDGATKYDTLPVHVVCAILGNWAWESNINPGIWENLSEGNWSDIGKGYGLGQWTNTSSQSMRLDAMQSWVTRTKGCYITDGYAQIEYFKHEGTWYKAGFATDFNSLEEFLNSKSTDLEYLTKAFYSGWEGLNQDDGSLQARIDWANDIYNYVYIQSPVDTSVKWISGNRWLTRSEILNNAKVVYQYLSTVGAMYTPTPDPSPIPIPPNYPSDGGGVGYGKKKMPIWMMVRKRYI